LPRITPAIACLGFAVVVTLTGSAGSGASAAFAQDFPPPANDDNCAGDATSAAAHFFSGIAPGLFGQLISTVGQQQQVDNLGFASCGFVGQTNTTPQPRQNP
jgi:hypothetical protein